MSTRAKKFLSNASLASIGFWAEVYLGLTAETAMREHALLKEPWNLPYLTGV